MVLPLTGIRVLDLSRSPAGSFCSWLLADFGAEVIWIEEPHAADGADRRDERDTGAIGRLNADAARIRAFDTLGRNKKSIALKLKDEAGLRIVRQLAASADVLLEDLPPGEAERLGIGCEDVRRINPRLIHCALSLYGQSGPYRDYSGHGPCALAVAGVLGLNAGEGQEPAFFGVPVDDVVAGLHAAIGVLIALQARRLTGEGQGVDISATDSALSLLANDVRSYFATGRHNKPKRRNLSFRIWRCQDGKYLATTNLEAHHWANFCRVVGRADLIPRQYDTDYHIEVSEAMREAFLSKTRAEWLSLLHQPEMETQVAPLHESLAEVFADPQVRHRGMLLELEHPRAGKVRQLGFPIKVCGTPAQVRRFAPLPGEHTDEVLRELGYDVAAISALEANGTIGRRGGA